MSTVDTDTYTLDAIFVAIDELQERRPVADTPIDYLRILGDLTGGIEGLIHQVITDTPTGQRDWQAIADALNIATADQARQSYEPPTPAENLGTF